MRSSAARALLVAILTIGISATSAQNAPSTLPPTTINELEEAWGLWAAEGSTDYKMRFLRDADEPVIAVVRAGALAEATVERTGAPYEDRYKVSTVEELFGMIWTALNDPRLVGGAIYDPKTGAPTEVDIKDSPPAEPGFESFAAANITIQELELLPPTGPPPPPVFRSTTFEGLERARELWAKEGSKDYVMNYTRGVQFFEDPFFPVIVTVRGGAVTEVALASTGAPSNATGIDTVEEVFDRIASDMTTYEGDVAVESTYHNVTGAPVKVNGYAITDLLQDYGLYFDIQILEFLTPTPTGGK